VISSFLLKKSLKKIEKKKKKKDIEMEKLLFASILISNKVL
jgi:hypothetical protein